MSKQSYIDFGDNFNFGELVVGELDCRRVVCRRVGLSASCPVTVIRVRDIGLGLVIGLALGLGMGLVLGFRICQSVLSGTISSSQHYSYA